MASQAVIFAETISGMKKALKRKAYDSDSDSSIEQLTNRGNKLKRKSRYVHEGQLAPPSGPLVYKRRINHAGFERDIISRNPPLVDEDGYEVDSGDDDERAQAAITAAAESDPYADVKIENLLAPLTAASELPDHPALSRPFTSKALTELTRQAGEMLRRENASLWRIKHLLTRLSGDSTWIPCESVENENDIALFFDERERQRSSHVGKLVSKDGADQLSTGTLQLEDAAPDLLTEPVPEAPSSAPKNRQAAGNELVIATTSENTEEAKDTFTEDAKPEHAHEDPGPDESQNIPSESTKPPLAGEMEVDKVVDSSQVAVTEVNPELEELEGNEAGDLEGADGQDDIPAPHRMRTRAQAQAASDNTAPSNTRSASPDSSAEPLVHPYFLAPRKSHSDRDLGLPQIEAEETRRLLQLYIQKQEEVCRGVHRVYEGLLRADRYRHLIIKWAKAEAHVGVNRDMSDGEDWYDKEEWELEEDLKKGQDEEDEDAATTAKKTRTRRQ